MTGPGVGPADRSGSELQPYSGRPPAPAWPRHLQPVDPYDAEPAPGAYLDPSADPAYGWPAQVLRPPARPRELPEARVLAAGQLSYGWSHRPLRADASPGYRTAVGNLALTVRVLVLGLAAAVAGMFLLVLVLLIARVLGWLL